MTELEQIKQYIEERLKIHEEHLDVFQDDVILMGQVHEDKNILHKIEEIILKRDTIKSDN